MKGGALETVYSDHHRLRAHQTELYGGQLVPPFEAAFRADLVRAAVAEAALGGIRPPVEHGLAPVLRVHDRGFVEFLQTAWARWQDARYEGEAIPNCFPVRRMAQRLPTHIEAQLGYYAFAAETSISSGTWEAARLAADCALTAADLVGSGQRAAFAICRPPGHHAAIDLYGGYCFLNNAAIAAQRLRDLGTGRVAVLDVDFHHGNGTQDIFYSRGDVLFASLHGEPAEAFPYFLGFADETGSGPGEGCNANYPMPRGTGYAQWRAALDDALGRVRRFGAEALVVSLGVDTFKDDPISFFRLDCDDYVDCGERIGRLGIPAVFCLEGGYGVPEIGRNAVNVLTGFEAGMP
jgi:acetoin utilization deacetylase AcuC-like enzyme